MGQVTITLNNRSYRLNCGPGEETRLRELADHLNLRIERLAMDFGQHGDERLLVMAALLATDELLDARARLVNAVAIPSAESAGALQDELVASAAEPAPTPEIADEEARPEPIAPGMAPAAESVIAVRPAPSRNSLEARLAAAKASAAPTKAGAA